MVFHHEHERIHAHGETSHTEHGLTYLADGWFRMVHGRRIEVRAGSFTLMPAGVPHQPLGGEGVTFWMVGFCASCLQLDESQLLMDPFRRVRLGALPVVPVARGRRRRVLRLYREMKEECERGAPESPELARSLLLLLLGEVRRGMHGGQGPEVVAAEGSLVSDALGFIQRHALEPISLKDVAGAVCRTPAHVAETVKRETGFTVGTWIANARVAEAAARLVHTDDSLLAIAEHVGWKDKTHFIRQFRKAYGITPAAYRRDNRTRHGSADDR
jgi:AraC-like DNA-binding protein